MIFVVYNTKTKQEESYPFNTEDKNDMSDFIGWDEELKNNPELIVKIIEK